MENVEKKSGLVPFRLCDILKTRLNTRETIEKWLFYFYLHCFFCFPIRGGKVQATRKRIFPCLGFNVGSAKYVSYGS